MSRNSIVLPEIKSNASRKGSTDSAAIYTSKLKT